MDVRTVIGARPPGGRPPQLVHGVVSYEQAAPAHFSDPLFVTVPGHSSEVPIRFDFWPAVNGATLPARGADVLVGYDERGVPFVVTWIGAHS